MQVLFLLAFVAAFMHEDADAQIPNTRDMITDTDMDHIWLEIGYTALNANTWTTVTTTVVNFNADNDSPLLAFFSLPEYGNSSFADSFPMVPKMNGRPYRNGDGSYSFEGILVMPDDAECSNEWWIPEDPGTLEMPWLIAESGVYNLSGNMIIVQEGNITRDNSNLVTNDTPYLTHHTVVFNYTTGCNSDAPEDPCRYDDLPSDDPTIPVDVTYYPWIYIGSLQQLQTSKRKANATHLHGGIRDVGGALPSPKELYLSVRGRRIFNDRAQYMVMTHAVDTNIYPDYEDVHDPELLAFMIYEKSLRIRCTEGLVIETEIFFDITSDSFTFDYVSTFDFPPGLFAMLGSMTSVGDSTVLRSFDRTTGSSKFITQEDKCVDQEQKHINEESAFAFVVGQASSDAEGQLMNCFAVFKNNQPTSVPSGQPSNVPSGEPSGAPSSVPSGAPSSFPSMSPNSEPSYTPTHIPTRSPTAVPTRSPTVFPTLSPTLQPSQPAGNCTFNFLLFDLFGDGFYTTFVNMTTTNHREENSTSQFHQPNCTAKVVSVYAETCSIDVSMLTKDGSNPLLTWESYWILNHDGVTYIGDFYSKLSIVHGFVTFSENLVDYSVPGKDGNKCHECPHPPPYNANSPPGVCDSSATAKHCPRGVVDGVRIPPPGKGKGGPGGGAGAGGKGGAGDGAGGDAGVDARRILGKDDDVNKTKTDDDKSSKDDDTNSTKLDDDKSSKDDDSNSTKMDDDKSSRDDDSNSTKMDDDRSGRDDDFYNSTDDGSGGGSDDHIHYSYGKPKPKPKPPYLVYINMFDELSNGYLDKSGDWSDYFNTQELVGTGGEYEELKEPILVPNVMAYPKYYLMTKDRRKLIKPPKAICNQNRGAEYCQEALPWNGHFIFRFAGIEPSDPADAATWEFCGISGGINEEFEFIMREGVCYPLTNKLTAMTYCEYGFETAISMNGAFSIEGDYTALSMISEVDTALLEKELALLMPGELAVKIQSITHEVENTFNVYFKASIIAESVGYDGSQVDKVDTMMYELEATLSEAFESGFLKSKLLSDLDALPNTQDDILRKSTGMKLLGYMEIDSMTYQDRQSGVTSHSGESGSSWSVPEQVYIVASPSHDEKLSETTGIISLAGVLVGALVAILVATSVIKHRNGETVDFGLPSLGGPSVFDSSGMEHSPLPVESAHALVQDTQLEVSHHPLNGLEESTRPTIDLSMSNVEAGHKAVYYADDIDEALYSHSKQQYEQNVANKRSFI
jgi:hypothetical protein